MQAEGLKQENTELEDRLGRQLQEATQQNKELQVATRMLSDSLATAVTDRDWLAQQVLPFGLYV